MNDRNPSETSSATSHTSIPVESQATADVWTERQEMIIEHPFSQRFPYTKILTTNERLQNLLGEAARVARSDATVLITGESGTGKELLAREIHRLSRRARHPLVIVNCAALSDQLVESELFGHVKGAFTGADRDKVGFFEAANGGTVFLDEIGEIGPTFQLKLLRVLEQGEFNRVGDVRPRYTDIRFIAATNQDLEAKVRAGTFREDLFYRLNVVTLTLPPLRERKDDIGLLTRYFVQHFANEMNKSIRWIAGEVIQALEAYDWPGNVRELRNVIHRAVILCDEDTLTMDTLPAKFQRPSFFRHQSVKTSQAPFDEADFNCSFREAKERIVGAFEKAYLTYHLRLNQGNVSRTARQTGLYGANLYEKLRRHQIDPDAFRPRTRKGSNLSANAQRVA